ncbi:MAG TPA: DNA-formamidopyrimidine glycosylase family protein [Solirubrobacteraceae bacterium]|nr:DNA-formamidopyrimidine glycosylase family protein [Solirubrobacteraceae bacterium]
MPEGDTIHHAANRMRPVLVGAVPQVDTPHPRLGHERWAERLADRAVTSVDARGKHLLIRFEGDRVLHSHLRMTGHWGTYRPGQRWGRSARRAWLVLRARDAEVVQFDGPVLELLTAARARADQRMAGLGPDVVAGEGFDEGEFLRRLRADDPTRPFGDALLDQRTVAGIGNLWKCEACFEAGIDPWRPTGEIGDGEALSTVRAARPRMQQSARDGHQTRHKAVYGRAGRPCPRCGARIRQRGQWDDNRPTFWCAGCQR